MRPRTPGSDRFAERVNQAVIRLDNSEPLSLVEAGTTGGSIYSDRRRHPSATVSYMRGMMSEFGITRLARVTGLDHVGVPVWSAIRPNAKTLAQSQGKGIDDPSAQASALMEAVEIATAERADLPARRATRRQLTSEGVVVDSIDVLLRKGGRRIADDEAVAWLSGSDLLSGQSVLVPYEAVTFSDASSPTRYWQTSDGLASGNTIWEAMLHGLCERIERDAMALWLLRDDDDVAARCVDPASFDDGELNRLCATIAKADLQLRLFDATCDTDTPVFGAFLSPPADDREETWRHFDLSSGWGCHPVAIRAALRAVTEAAQTRLTTISAARDDFDPRRYREVLDPSLLVYPRASPKRHSRFGGMASFDRSEFLLQLLDRLKAAGIDSVIVVPLERGDRGFAVCRVLVPGLENPSGDRERQFGPRAFAFAEANL